MTTVVISQPFLFPWVGLFEQIRLADHFIHYDDVAYSKGSFVNRVQLKSPRGSEWMTIPLAGRHLGDRIVDLDASGQCDWRARHLEQLERLYRPARFQREMIALVETVYSSPATRLIDILLHGLDLICNYFDLSRNTQFHRSSQLMLAGRSSQRVLAVVEHFRGDVYITGHGAKNYLDHEAFEARGVDVRYMDYQRCLYPQLHGSFDPHVSILDLIANCGRDGRQYVCSSTIPWREFLARQSLAG